MAALATTALSHLREKICVLQSRTSDDPVTFFTNSSLSIFYPITTACQLPVYVKQPLHHGQPRPHNVQTSSRSAIPVSTISATNNPASGPPWRCAQTHAQQLKGRTTVGQTPESFTAVDG